MLISQRKKKVKSFSSKYLLVSDNHPEVPSVAQLFEANGVDFRLCIEPFFTSSEFNILSKFVGNRSRIDRLKKRTLPRKIFRRNVKRPGMGLFLLSYLLNMAGLHPQAEKVRSLFYGYFQLRTYSLRRLKNYTTIITSIYLTKHIRRDSIVFAISPSIHPISENKFRYLIQMNAKSIPEKVSLIPKANIENIEALKTINAKIVCLSEFAKRTYLENGFAPENVFVVKSGARISVEELASVRRLAIKPLRILYLGRLSVLKGLEVFLQTALEFRGKFQFILAGTTNNLQVSEYLTELTKREGILFIDKPLNDQEIMDLFSRADIFLSPSWFEGFGMTIVEAMISGLIPIASTSSIFRDIARGSILEELQIDASNPTSVTRVLNRIYNMDDTELIALSSYSRRVASLWSIQNFPLDLSNLVFGNQKNVESVIRNDQA